MSKSAPGVRYAEIERETNETKVRVVLDLDGGTRSDVATGIPFLDHMLHQVAFHGRIDLGVQCEGDLEIDDHHSVEDIGLVFGTAFAQAAEAGESIVRYASGHFPMDEALVLVAIDVCGRPTLVWDVPFTRDAIGALSLENVHEFFQAFVNKARISLHVKKIHGSNDHHICEAVFKGFGICLYRALQKSDRRGSPSTKGKL